MVECIVWIAIIMIFLYWVLPAVLSRGFGFGVIQKGPGCHRIAFTFDDGPNPTYTPQLLDLLKRYNIKATFFVLGSKAEQYPQLILRMHQEGHVIGIHNYIHQANWLMTPWAVRRQLHRAALSIERIIGVRPIYYRPPWGLLNLFDFLLYEKVQIVLWSVIVGDWRSKGGSEKIKRKLLQKIHKGAIIVLHDNGETFGADEDAPLYMIKALETVFQEIRSQGYTCVRIDEMLQRKEK